MLSFLNFISLLFGIKIIGAVLISTLEDALKEAFTPKVKKAWIKVYGVIEAQMKIGMKQYESETRAKMNKSEDNITTATIKNSNGDVTLATEQQPSDQNHTDMNNNNSCVSNGIIHT